MSKIGDEIKLPTGKKVLKMISGRPRWIFIPDEGGEKQRQSQTKLFGADKPVKISTSDLKTSVDAGTIIRIRYHGPKAHDPRPIILFLSVWEGRMHGINIKYLEPKHIQTLKNIIYATWPKVQNPKQFYDSILKVALKNMLKKEISAYRTYAFERIDDIHVYGGLPDVRGIE